MFIIWSRNIPFSKVNPLNPTLKSVYDKLWKRLSFLEKKETRIIRKLFKYFSAKKVRCSYRIVTSEVYLSKIVHFFRNFFLRSVFTIFFFPDFFFQNLICRISLSFNCPSRFYLLGFCFRNVVFASMLSGFPYFSAELILPNFVFPIFCPTAHE